MFPVEIWGTVAQWVSALGTSGAAIAAAGYYINDKRIEAKKQARLVRTRFTASGDKVVVNNHSPLPVVDVFLAHRPQSFEETVPARGWFGRRPRETPEQKQRRMIGRLHPFGMYQYLDLDMTEKVESIGSNGSAMFDYSEDTLMDHVCRVVFTDIRGVCWMISPHLDSLERVKMSRYLESISKPYPSGRIPGPVAEYIQKVRLGYHATRWAKSIGAFDKGYGEVDDDRTDSSTPEEPDDEPSKS